jgi:transcriptional regulator with XRE-family HTH domain
MRRPLQRFGENIRFYRNLRGLTQTALARKVMVAPAYISQIEANQRVPSLKVTRRIAEILEIDLSVLLRENDRQAIEGKLSDSEKLDLLRTLMLSIEAERKEDAPEPRTVRRSDFSAMELHSEPSYSVFVRDFAEPRMFGRESPDVSVECHVILEGRAWVVYGGKGRELPEGSCYSLSSSNGERLQSDQGTRVLSVYGPRLDLPLIAASPVKQESISG